MNSTSLYTKRPRICAIEGNIGAGKTTIFEQLKTHFKNNRSVVFMPEPVDIWETIRDASGKTILEKFYADPKYAFSFQIMAYSTRLAMLRKTIREHPDCELIICERSLEADRNIFAKMLFDDGVIDEICYQIYKKIYSEYADMFPVSGIVYIDADADVCAKRIEKRARDGEAGIQLDYLEKCKKYHDEWLITDTKNAKKLLRIKTNEDDVSGDLGNKWIKWISDFIDED